MNIDFDVEMMDRVQLKAEIRRLRAGIREHRDCKGHDRCWRDDVEILYAMLPETTDADLRLPPLEEFIPECIKFWQCRRTGIIPNAPPPSPVVDEDRT